MACLFGHKWNGCKCEKCGKTRDQDHRFQAGDHPCVQVCAVCGAEKTEHGAYVNGFCEECGSASRFPIDCSALTAEEITEVKPVLAGYVQQNFSVTTNWVPGDRLSLMYARQGAYNDKECKPDEENNSVYDACAAFHNLDTGCMTPPQGKILVTVVKCACEKLNDIISRAPQVEPKPDDCKTLTEQQQQPVESMNPLTWSNELYKTGMALDRRKHQTAIRGTLRLLESALQKMEHAVSLYEEEAAKRGVTYENPADIRERYNQAGQ